MSAARSARYKKVSTVSEETGERVVLVRGHVSKKYNSRETWLRLTRERRTRLARKWRQRNREKYLAQQERRNGRDKQLRARWERENEKRRKSPRRKLFNKLRHNGVPMEEARALARWGKAA